jgi:hypothetical protein
MPWKDILCFMGMLALWAIVSHFDYEEAVAWDAAARPPLSPPCAEPGDDAPGTPLRPIEAPSPEDALQPSGLSCASLGLREVSP